MEVVRRCIDAFWSGEFETAFAACNPDVELDVSVRPEGRVFRGLAGVTEAIRSWGGTWEDWAAESEELIDAGDRVLLVDRQTGRGKSSGAPLDQQTFWVYTLRDGTIVRIKWFGTDREEALEAAGLEE